ncbi:DNA recombination protein RmuC [Inhella gelatinilytica]|uniref:DNA recombination protein RmuC n=1 Tax=Inhella gelatinilytica TaxID=2795030 RepID=A0A931NG34_9BURK|nr:DNA recombination protein RmuC [Inhella gelatinilytica]MBH9554181.1 DNA recombination protein RmuC [Inhella gelatinilytica]
MPWLELVILGLALLNAVLVLMLLRRPVPAPDLQPLQQALQLSDRNLRDEVQRSGQAARQELLGQLTQFQTALGAQSGEAWRTQNEQIDSFRVQLAGLQQALTQGQTAAREALDAALARSSTQLREQLQALIQANEQRMAELRHAVEQRLTGIQQDNAAKLEQMRQTVDEKLHATLEQRLGESFKQVAERLEQVHRGLGDMQNLARDVGSLSRVLSGVKTRGVFGEVQLAGLLEQVFTLEQYDQNVATVPGSNERVEFAIRLPGQGIEGPLWLPIDAKFPREDYERLLDAQERADAPAAEAAGKALETRLRLEAKTIADKYLAPPHTTDFALLFLPTEGLYAECLRRPGLFEALQREHKVMLTGPTTLLATLGSLQMGFRTLALEKRSAEVWSVLGAVKTEFGKFGDVLAKTKKKLQEASNTIDAAEVRTRAMTRQLKGVEALPDSESQKLLPLPALDDGDDAI